DCNCKIVTEADTGVIPVGPPESGVTEQIMDIDGNSLPPHVVGELWIGGPGVALGYLGKPELTAERFVTWNGTRYYRSGDLAKWNASGEVLILGRNDNQIKLRGLRIELGEVENAIGATEGITRAVILVNKIRGQEHLCAYYTADREIEPAALRAALSATLPKYMVPTAYSQLESMPVTPNGKIDTKALPAPALMMEQDYEAPATEAEKAFCEIFAQALGLEKVGASDNFFDLGGTSLLVARVTAAAMSRGYSVSYGDVFSDPTPRRLAALTSGETPAPPAQAEEDYDYAKINALLAGNTIAALTGGQNRPLGNICLTGATGFLGIHVLRAFLESERGLAYCVVRGGRTSAESRLKTMLAYYFEDDYAPLFGSRIFVADGDICGTELYEKLDERPIDTYINCAANVKHFSEGTDIEDINVGGAKNAIAFCRKKGCRLIQVSTCSIAGTRVDNVPDGSLSLDETMLYFGQDISNQYLHSKFVAERAVLEAIDKGLDAKIMRVGNLMARSADGEFQINWGTNSFLGLLKAYCIVGSVPYDVLSEAVEFSAVDFAAQAVLALTQTPRQCVVFHPYNNHVVFFRDIRAALAGVGIDLRACEADEWDARYSEALTDPDKAKYLLSLFAYNAREGGQKIAPIATANAYTVAALDRLGFVWPVVTDSYLNRFMEAMAGLGYFEGSR
ncbi:MAG: SDR family oxidoreductase, partial [Clostridiales bacterium]|nr:SDR family oxidoreductase [Clostridiales bacterium]